MNFFAVIDTNVLVSAMLKWNSVPGNVLELTLDGPIVPLVNEEILNEYTAVLSRPKFRFTKEIVDAVVREIRKRAVFLDAEELSIELPDPKDRIFYEVVMEERKREDAYLVTGNIKHFPTEPFVVTPRQMIDIILNSSN